MPRFTPKRYEQILAQMIATVTARGKLTDVTDSSAVKHVLAAAARQDDELYYQASLLLQLFSIDSATGDDLDERAKDIQPAVVSRNQAVRATGYVCFSRGMNLGDDQVVTIPAGTKVKTASGLVFTTQAVTTIDKNSPQVIGGHGTGRDAPLVVVLADDPGAAGNVAANTVIKFQTKPGGVDEVTNPSAFGYGMDKETDDAFRERLKSYIRSLARSTVEALRAGAIGAQDPATGRTVAFAKVIEDVVNRGEVTLYIDDGTGAVESTQAVAGEVITYGLAGPPVNAAVGGEEYLTLDHYPTKASVAPSLSSSTRGALTRNTHYKLNETNGKVRFTPVLAAGEIITGSYTYYTGLISYVQKIIDGDPNDRANFPGLRAAGVRVSVIPPSALTQTVTATVTVLEGFTAATVKTNVRTALVNYINGLGIGTDVLRLELNAIIASVAGVYNVASLVLNGSGSADQAIGDDQIARTTSGNVTIS